MKKMALSVLVMLGVGIACNNSSPVNLANPTNLVSPLTCPVGSVLAPQGVLPQGNCPAGQGVDPTNPNQCDTGTPCQGIGLNGTGTGSLVGYTNTLNITNGTAYVNLMYNDFGFCQTKLAFGTAECRYYENNLSIVIEAIVPSGGVVSGMNSVYVTLYAGVPRVPLVYPCSYYPINNSAGFELRAIGYPFILHVDSGTLGGGTTPNSFLVHLLYQNAEFANGIVNQFE